MEQKVSSAARSGTPQGMKDAMKKATTEMLVLFMLRQKTMYSYEMMQEIARLTKQMKEAAKMLEFEIAAQLRDQIKALEEGK